MCLKQTWSGFRAALSCLRSVEASRGPLLYEVAMRAALIYSAAVFLLLGAWVLLSDPLASPDPASAGDVACLIVFLVAGGVCFVGGTNGLLPPLCRTNTALDESLEHLRGRL
jgi:peptidoglycan/LPS O-acetylase OafA/YrhL